MQYDYDYLMASKKYRNKRCGYCGNNTGLYGEGEHVLPHCFYPEGINLKAEFLRIPSCQICNRSWAKHEAHARNILVACGLIETDERRQVWQRSLRSFGQPISGKGDVWAVAQSFVPSPILNEHGRPYQRIFPCQDARVVGVLKKIVRGLNYHKRREVIADGRVVVTVPTFPIPTEFDRNLASIYEVPQVFKGQAYFCGSDGLHSFWSLDFFNNARVIGAILE